MISRYFPAMLTHGALPTTGLYVTLPPVLKDNEGKLSNRDNYRSIAIATVMSNCITFKRIERYLGTEFNRFGYKII